ncbi:hypothetical protein IW150_003314 [Coemansia sp. RSA 2607]|nr:hypothetical protein IW150_003314 [Coemansia sp. RSA 2607]
MIQRQAAFTTLLTFRGLSAKFEATRSCKRLLANLSTENDVSNHKSVESKSDWNISPVDQTTALSSQVFGVPNSPKPLDHWTQDEEASFNKIVSTHLIKNHKIRRADWIKYSTQFGCRSHQALKSRYDSSHGWLNESHKPHWDVQSPARLLKESTDQGRSRLRTFVRWSTTEDDALRTAVDIYGPHKWKMIADFVGTRSHIQCRGRWHTLTSPHLGTWGPILHWAHDSHQRRRRKAIIVSLGKGGAMASARSSVVSALLSQQYGIAPDTQAVAGIDVGEIQPLNGRMLVRPFSAEEDRALLRLVRTYGARWAMIAGMLTKRFGLPAHTSDTDSGLSNFQPRTPIVVYKRYYALIHSHNKLSAQASSTTGSLAVSSPGRVHQNQKRAGSRKSYQRWTDEEITALTGIIESMIQSEHGFTSWIDVARKMKQFDRSANQCRYFWMLRGGTHLRHTPFTAAEDKILWPFVLSGLSEEYVDSGRQQQQQQQQRQKRLYGRHLTATYKQSNNGPASTVGIGWLSTGPLTGRSTRTIRMRIRRLQHIIEWLRVEGQVDRPERLFDLVHGLADCPSSFRISKPKHQSL